MANFDLFSYARGAEYGIDQNAQDENNAYARRRNDAELNSFEQQLRAFDETAPLRQEVLTKNLENAKLRGIQINTQLRDQYDYDALRRRAFEGLSPEEVADTSEIGGLARATAIQRYMQQNGGLARHQLRFLPELQAARGAVLARAQYDPSTINQVLQHQAFDGGRLQIEPVPDAEGQYQIMRATTIPADANNPQEMRAYVPMEGARGNIDTVMNMLRSTFDPKASPDLGAAFRRAEERTDYLRGRTRLIDQRAGAVALGGLGVKKDVAAARTKAGDARNDSRDYATDVRARMAVAKGVQQQLAQTEAAIIKLRTGNADVRQITPLQERHSALLKQLEQYRTDLVQ
jgi:hypothetical protein